MGFKRESAAKKKPRRSSRLSRQRLKRIGAWALAAALLCSCAGYLYTTGSFTRLGARSAEGVMALSASAGFRVEDVVVAGRENMPAEMLREKLDIRRGMPIFHVDIAALQKEIEALAWVETARVSRRLPATIAIDITERRPVALWQYKKELSVVDASGAVLTKDSLSAFGDLPLVVGAGAGENVTQLLALMRAEPELAGFVTSAVRVGSRRWDLHLENGVVVKLPEENAGLALASLARVEREEHILGKDISTVDLRLPDRVVVAPGKNGGRGA